MKISLVMLLALVLICKADDKIMQRINKMRANPSSLVGEIDQSIKTKAMIGSNICLDKECLKTPAGYTGWKGTSETLRVTNKMKELKSSDWLD